MSEKQTKPSLPKIPKCPVNLTFHEKLGWVLEGDRSRPECQKTYEQIYKNLGPNARSFLDRRTKDISSKKK